MDGIFFPDAEIEPETIDPDKVTRKMRAHGPELMIVEVSFASGGARHGTICVAEGRLLDTFTPRRDDFLEK